jgi:hypothetical protein
MRPHTLEGASHFAAALRTRMTSRSLLGAVLSARGDGWRRGQDGAGLDSKLDVAKGVDSRAVQIFAMADSGRTPISQTGDVSYGRRARLGGRLGRDRGPDKSRHSIATRNGLHRLKPMFLH